MLTAIDISNWTGDIEPATVRCWKAAGVKKLIVGTQNETMTRRQVGVAQSEGLPIELYVYLYFDRDPVAKVKAAADLAHAADIFRIWLDAEDTSTAKAPDRLIADLQGCVQAVRDRGIDPGIYTGAWWWKPRMGNSAAFRDLDLWYSHYDGQPNFNDWYAGFAFGGWEHPTGKQYAGTTQLCGKGVDLNYFKEDEMPRERPETYSAPQQAAILAMFCAVAAGEGRPLASFFNPIGDQKWAQAWAFVGAPEPPPQPSFVNLQKHTALVAPRTSAD